MLALQVEETSGKAQGLSRCKVHLPGAAICMLLSWLHGLQAEAHAGATSCDSNVVHLPQHVPQHATRFSARGYDSQSGSLQMSLTREDAMWTPDTDTREFEIAILEAATSTGKMQDVQGLTMALEQSFPSFRRGKNSSRPMTSLADSQSSSTNLDALSREPSGSLYGTSGTNSSTWQLYRNVNQTYLTPPHFLQTTRVPNVHSPEVIPMTPSEGLLHCGDNTNTFASHTEQNATVQGHNSTAEAVELRLKLLKMGEQPVEAMIEALQEELHRLCAPVALSTEGHIVSLTGRRADLLRWFNTPHCRAAMEVCSPPCTV